MNSVKEPLTKPALDSVEVGMDWVKTINPTDTILTSEWSCSSPDIVFSRQQITAKVTSCVVSGGTDGELYKVYNKITTANEVYSRYFVLVIDDIQVSV